MGPCLIVKLCVNCKHGGHAVSDLTASAAGRLVHEISGELHVQKTHPMPTSVPLRTEKARSLKHQAWKSIIPQKLHVTEHQCWVQKKANNCALGP